MSSAHIRIFVHGCKLWGHEDIKKLNKIGLSTEPWGKPTYDILLNILIFIDMHQRYLIDINLQIFLMNLISISRLTSWSAIILGITLSYANFKSMKVAIVFFLSIKPLSMSAYIVERWKHTLLPFLKPWDWLSNMLECSVHHSNLFLMRLSKSYITAEDKAMGL